MTNESLLKGNELTELIKITENGLNAIKSILKDKRKNSDNKYYEDDHYWLSISKHSDRSGGHAELDRYLGNTELLNVIKDTLEKQLKLYKGILSKL